MSGEYKQINDIKISYIILVWLLILYHGVMIRGLATGKTGEEVRFLNFPYCESRNTNLKKGDVMSETLRTLRERAGFTQKEVADLVGATPNSINNWEKDSTNLKDRFIKKFMVIYGVGYDDIFLGKEHRISVPLVEKRVS